jgi:hypothetical protein
MVAIFIPLVVVRDSATIAVPVALMIKRSIVVRRDPV